MSFMAKTKINLSVVQMMVLKKMFKNILNETFKKIQGNLTKKILIQNKFS